MRSVLVLLALLVAGPAFAVPTHLVWTNPVWSRTEWRAPGEDGDSVLHVECAIPDTTKPTRQLREVYLYGYPFTGGGWRLEDSLGVIGREGLTDSLPIPYFGRFYVISCNPVGCSCASNIATVLPPVTTGVEPTEPVKPPTCRIHDVSGRLAGELPWAQVQGKSVLFRPPFRVATGIYFVVCEGQRPRRMVILK